MSPMYSADYSGVMSPLSSICVAGSAAWRFCRMVMMQYKKHTRVDHAVCGGARSWDVRTHRQVGFERETQIR